MKRIDSYVIWNYGAWGKYTFNGIKDLTCFKLISSIKKYYL